ncbi:MAG: ATP synthase F0 subunit A [Bacteroidetes bacterium QH_7_62_13]|nr:MAG: ATP synthase F0 subunit A [Bacteroidetes bacterium QH_7_62_13]
MIARLRSIAVLGLLALGLTLAVSTSPAQAAAEEGEVTLEGIVNNSILGHATDGYYLNLKPFAQVELPRIMLARTEEGALTVEAYGSTAGLLRNGPYGLQAHDGNGSGDHGQAALKTETAELNEAIGTGEHLHSSVARTSGHVVTDFSISRHLVLSILAFLIVTVIFVTLAQRYERGVGRTEARTFLPYLLSSFFFILVANILGLVPFAGAPTSNLAVTAVLAVMTFVIGLLYGSKDHYMELLTGPPDAPILARIILVPIEIIGLVMRHLALAIRLFANMLGGSLIIFSLLGLIFIMNVIFGEAAAWGSTIISIGFTVFILLVKLLVAFIQAYVFTILSALFIGMSAEEHHYDEDADTSASEGDLESRLDAVEDAIEPTPA